MINSTAGAPFSLKVISLNLAGAQGLLNGFDPSQPYAWTIFDYSSLSPLVFDPSSISIDTSAFANSLAFGPAGNGTFSLSDSGGSIMLNFTPVPEPSTYALMVLGLSFIGLTVWRRRRA